MLVQACGLLWKAEEKEDCSGQERRSQRRSTTIAMQKRKSCLIIG